MGSREEPQEALGQRSIRAASRLEPVVWSEPDLQKILALPLFQPGRKEDE